MSYVTVITEPTLEPITLADAKQQCNIDVDHDGQNTLIESFIVAARDYVEWRTGITVHEKTLQLHLDRWPCGAIELPGATPLIAVTSVTYYDSDNTPTVWSSSNYATSVGSNRKIGRIAPNYGVSYPSFTPYALDPIRIRYRAGIAIASPATEAEDVAKQSVRELVAGMFANRESEIVTDRAVIAAIAMNYGVEAMIARLRVAF